MDVSITNLRSDLATWIARAQAGEDVVITDRGTPVARLSAVDSAPLIEKLIREGAISRPTSKTRTRSKDIKQVTATGSMSDLISELRR